MLPSTRLLAALSLLAVAALRGQGGQGGRERPPERRPGLSITCSPGSVTLSGKRVDTPNPIAYALDRAGPGSTIEVLAGDYPAFSLGLNNRAAWSSRSPGGTRAEPVRVRARGKVRIRPGKSGDTIAIAQQVPCAWVTFEGLEIEPGNRAGIMFYVLGPSQSHQGFHFIDCDVIGSWDHVAKSGRPSKWGVWASGLDDFVFRGETRPAVIRDIQKEHAFYLNNPRGDITIENVQASRLGRTFCQFRAPADAGPPGRGTITVKNCTVEDACIAAGDGYKGGSAFTVAGRLTGKIVFEKNAYRAGFDPQIRTLTRDGEPYGTGAFVCWDAGGQPNGTLILEDNVFEMAPGCGDRPLVSIGGCRELVIRGRNRFLAGGFDTALHVDPLQEGRLTNTPVGSIAFDPATEVRGSILMRGEVVEPGQLAPGAR